MIRLMLLAIGLMAGCSSTSHWASMANPASVYCVETCHGVLLMRKSPVGEIGVCRLPSGEEVEEWALFHREHPSPSAVRQPFLAE